MMPIAAQDCLRFGLWQIRERFEKRLLGRTPTRFELKAPASLRATPELAQSFEKLGPWHTQFRIDGQNFGGPADYTTDYRFSDFINWYPDGGRVLDIGSFEGMHSFLISDLPGVTEVVGLEGRDYNVRKAQFTCDLFQKKNVQFFQRDVQNADLGEFGRFDAVFSAGLLYHLSRPWEHIQEIARVSDRLFLSTHYSLTRRAERGGYRGRVYREFGYQDSLSGLEDQSFWPTFEDLKRMLKASGFEIRHSRHYSKGIHLPLVDLFCEKL